MSIYGRAHMGAAYRDPGHVGMSMYGYAHVGAGYRDRGYVGMSIYGGTHAGAGHRRGLRFCAAMDYDLIGGTGDRQYATMVCEMT